MAALNCPRCQCENSDDNRFCEGCGAPLDKTCSSCGHANRSNARFCGGCGIELAGVEPPGRAEFAAPQSYTPRHLADRIRTARGAVEGERKQVTVLFADIQGALELIRGSDPERVHELLDSTIRTMMEAVHRYEGTVNKVLGDGIMALFGAPLAHEDHAVRACYAALAMQDAIRRSAEEVRRSHGVEMLVRVGLNSGEVVVRAIGNDLTMDYDAIGETTHLAGRMEQLAVPGTIRMTGDVLQLAEGFVQVNDLGPIPVKGLEEPVEVFELTSKDIQYFRADRLIIDMQIVMDIWDPIGEEVIHRTFRRRLLCGENREPIPAHMTDTKGWPDAQGEIG